MIDPIPNAAPPGTGMPPIATSPGVLRVAAAYAVHAFTASGVVLAFLATAEVCAAAPDPRVVFALLAAQVLVDAVDGPLARLLDVKRVVPRISGRTIDDLVDYLTYTFVPLLLVWRMGWVPAPAAAWVAPAMMASLFGFANVGAKDEGGGFFLGFPSYWNIVAFYLGLWHATAGGGAASLWAAGLSVVALSVLTVLPVRFVYPNLAPYPWRWPMWLGGAVWAVSLAAMLPGYPNAPSWLLAASLAYPVGYVALSIWLDARARMTDKGP
jgi:phosphatidylcholine synthase